MEVIGRANIVKNRIEKRRLDFARHVFGTRLRGMIDAPDRLEKFDKIAREQLNGLKSRFQIKDATKTTAGTSSSWTVTSSSQN